MTETPNTTPKPKRKYGRRRRAAAKEKTMPDKKVPSEFEGITPLDCCDACNAERCVITGMGLCGHPFKGGLQPAQMMQPETLNRYKRAKRALGEAKLNLQEMAGV